MKKVMRIEKSLEGEEREKRRKNIVIKGVETKDGNKREAVEELLKVIDVKVEITEIRRIGVGMEKGRGEMLLVKLGNKEQKWEIMTKKKNLKGRKERVYEDLTWREVREK